MRAVTCPFGETLNLPKDMIYCDLTLREGEQSPGVNYTNEEKIELVKKLDEIGISQIQLTTPGLNPTILDLCKTICDMKLNAKMEIMTAAMQDNWKEQIDAAAACGPDIIHAGFEVSQYNQVQWNESVKENLLKRIAETTAYLKQTGKLINISFTDATRAEFTFLMQCVETAAAKGANRIRICDSFGVGTPEALSLAVSCAVRIAKPYGTIVGVHCHNDFGLALANTFACIRAGAGLIDLCINGLGDRAGNTCLIEAMITLEAIYKQPTGLNVRKCTELSHYVEKISGIAISPSKPFTGSNVFAEEAASHAIEQFTRPIEGRSLVPEDIGGHLGVIYGKLTNEIVIELTVKKAGKKLDKKYYGEILQKLYTEAERRKGIAMYEKDFWEIAEQVARKV